MIETHGLTKRYGPTNAVNQLTIQVRPGKVTGFLGPNGAGKSTTLRMIVGIDNPTSGTALVGGRPYRQLKHPLNHVGALLDAKYAHPGRTARNHLKILAQSNKIPKRRADEVLGMVGLESAAGKRLGKFSLGMSQRLGIAAALLGDPQVLIFDEPINGLDPEGIRWVRDLMKSLAAQGRTVLVSSHLMSEMAVTADDLVVIGLGRLITHTTIEQFIADNSVGYVKVRSPQSEDVARAVKERGGEARPERGWLHVTGLTIEQVGDLATDRGLRLHELSPQSGSLEDAYLRLTQTSVQYRASTLAMPGQGAPVQASPIQGAPVQPIQGPPVPGRTAQGAPTAWGPPPGLGGPQQWAHPQGPPVGWSAAPGAVGQPSWSGPSTFRPPPPGPPLSGPPSPVPPSPVRPSAPPADPNRSAQPQQEREEH